MKYKLAYAPEALKGIQKLPTQNLKRLAEKILVKISETPFAGTKLLGKLEGLYSARVTRQYRILYQIHKKSSTVIVLDLKHRKESYG